MDMNSLVLFLLRWIHFIAGITWIGHLYFFNFVQGPFEKTLDADCKKKVVPQLRPRALWWFRWGAMVTFLAGVLYIIWKQLVIAPPGGQPEGFTNWFMIGDKPNPYGIWITFGGLLGTVMWFNVWFIIWPAQKKIIGWIKAGEKPPEMDATVKRAFLASRLNTYLSVPMLFGMGGAQHFPGEFQWYWLLIALAVGMGVAHLLIKISPRVGTE